MAGFVVNIKYLGRYYDICVSDIEIENKYNSLRNYYSNVNDLTIEDIAEMVANEKIALSVHITNQNNNKLKHGIKCDLCGAGHRMIRSITSGSSFALFYNKKPNITGDFSPIDLNIQNQNICEKCLSDKYNQCSICKNYILNDELENNKCLFCSMGMAPLRANQTKH